MSPEVISRGIGNGAQRVPVLESGDRFEKISSGGLGYAEYASLKSVIAS